MSGNPSGRPKRTVEEFRLIQVYQDKTPAALAVIERLMRSARKDRVRLAAAIFIIERAYGKAPGTQPEERDALSLMSSIEILLRLHVLSLPSHVSAPTIRFLSH